MKSLRFTAGRNLKDLIQLAQFSERWFNPGHTASEWQSRFESKSSDPMCSIIPFLYNTLPLHLSQYEKGLSASLQRLVSWQMQLKAGVKSSMNVANWDRPRALCSWSYTNKLIFVCTDMYANQYPQLNMCLTYNRWLLNLVMVKGRGDKTVLFRWTTEKWHLATAPQEKKEELINDDMWQGAIWTWE